MPKVTKHAKDIGFVWRNVTTEFQFMANKQLRMEKWLGTSVCADISQYALKKQYVKILYEKITQNFFLDENTGFL